MPGKTPMTLSAAFRIACTSGDPSWVLRSIIAALRNTLGPLWHALQNLLSHAWWLLVKAAHAIQIIVEVIVKTAWWIAIKLVALVSNILKGVAVVISKVFALIASFGLLGLFFGTTIATIVLYLLYPQQVTDYAIVVLGYLKEGFELGKEKAKEAWQSDMGEKVTRFVDAALDALPGALRKVRGAAEGAWNMLVKLVKEIKELLGNQPLGTYRRIRVD